MHSSSCECGYGCCLLTLRMLFAETLSELSACAVGQAGVSGAACPCGQACNLLNKDPRVQGVWPLPALTAAALRTALPPHYSAGKVLKFVEKPAADDLPSLRRDPGKEVRPAVLVPCRAAVLCCAASARLAAPAPRVHSLCPAASFGAGACVAACRPHRKLALQLQAHSSHARPTCCVSPSAAAGRRVPGQHGHLCVQAGGAV